MPRRIMARGETTMEPRLVAGYLLILVLVVSAAAIIAYRFYHSDRRRYKRRQRREEATYVQTMSEREDTPPK
jgi:Tfp pilus assembly protein PilO